jgi:serine phosphatase RsbU (regulator of sigma subunit)
MIDCLSAETVPLAFAAVQKGWRVLAQFDSILWGAGVAHSLGDLGVPSELLSGMTWIFTVQRLACLCPYCKQSTSLTPFQLRELGRLREHLHDMAIELRQEPIYGQTTAVNIETELGNSFYRADGCVKCQNTGRFGDVAAFDVFRAGIAPPYLFEQPSLLPMRSYLLELAMQGRLTLDDALQFETHQLRRTFPMLTAKEIALAESSDTLARKLAELEASNRVLKQRTEVLFSLQDLSQAMISSTDLDNLAARVCRRARELCSADRAVLYFLRPTGKVEVLAVGGWDATLVHRQLDVAQVFGVGFRKEPTSYSGPPPGIQLDSTEDGKPGLALQTGLQVPLFVQKERVGLMIVHSTQKPLFTPGEVALLQSYANQAALAIQRAGLIDELRGKIKELEAAQAELVQKERLERELELARQVQQSMLPREFPQVPGYVFAARNETARQVGGDFYDVIWLDDDRFGLIIGDVSGKGMPAALYMALTRSLLLAESRRERSPRAVLNSVNQILMELGDSGHFVSVFYGVVEQAARRLSYARAGHDYPLLLRDGLIQPLRGAGTVLGLLEPQELQLSEEQVALTPGDRLVLYTDGLTDVMAGDGEIFDLGRLKVLLQTHADLPLSELCSATFESLATFQGEGEQFDDMTLLVMEVR